MAVIKSKWLENIPNFSVSRPSKIYPNFFRFENIPSGNPVSKAPTRFRYFFRIACRQATYEVNLVPRKYI
jgi:hypothetical protein